MTLITFTKPVLMVDTREKRPLFGTRHRGQFSAIVRSKLDAGDYAFLGGQTSLAFERKSLEDLIGTVTTGRDRFYRELERMKSFDYAAIIIEDTYDRVANPYGFSKTNPHSVIGSLQSFQLRFDVDVIFAGNRSNAEDIILNKIEAVFYAGGKAPNVKG